MGRWISLALLLIAPLAVARPAPDQLMDAPVLRQASAYSFSSLELDSADGARHYRIWLGQPSTVSDTTPVAYLLDGNAAMAALDSQSLDRLAHSVAPPVLVAVGYATPLRIERTARTFDYTPKVGSAMQQRDPLTAVPSGGADVFLDLLTGTVRPLINQRLGITPQRQLLWGHSYGGLLVLHALLTRPQAFDDYAAASPSLWWNQGLMTAEANGLAQRLRGSQPRLLLMRGDQEPAGPGAVSPAKEASDTAFKALLGTLHQVDGLHVRHLTFTGLGHGPMLPASLRYTLQMLSQGR
ncbi:alpha/beta hydrolase [Pseudomonas proteolytica]|uniref:alpha/beta hydrolase n=1 Tax=Pseudomonas proteolytica TaxID=219574 RepID=UPI001474A6BF|nr:alpha/beta hydrolase-fold protein [Pseudomonas proteolytica]NMY95788.1 alpha/beta hydrolase [Pseudomonas proteolytica]